MKSELRTECKGMISKILIRYYQNIQNVYDDQNFYDPTKGDEARSGEEDRVQGGRGTEVWTCRKRGKMTDDSLKSGQLS